MNEHTFRILARVASLLTDYRSGGVDLEHLVSSLEGSLRAIEERLGAGFYDRWAVQWGILEEVRVARIMGDASGQSGERMALEVARMLELLIRSEIGQRDR
jgi:hypothetical protein